MRRLLGVALLMLGACREEVPEQPASPEQIERLSTPAPKKADDPERLVRLLPLSAADLATAGTASCRFTSGADLLISASAEGGVVRLGDDLRHLVASAPVGPSGAFLEDRQLSVSIGLTGETSAPARAKVTHRRSDVEHERRGLWTCAQ